MIDQLERGLITLFGEGADTFDILDITTTNDMNGF